VLEDLAQDGQVLLYAAAQNRWAKAHTLSYDAARKSVEVLLLTRGWRVSGRGGGHLAIVAVVDAWLGTAQPPGPRIARKFAAAVVARHAEEYPHPRDPARTDRELRELALDNIRLMNLARQVADLEPRDDHVPTEANLAGFTNAE
jgi:hypothetical protein